MAWSIQRIHQNQVYEIIQLLSPPRSRKVFGSATGLPTANGHSIP